MSLLNNLKNDLKNDANKMKVEAGKLETKIDTPDGRKWIRYVAYGSLVIFFLIIGSCMLKACKMTSQEHKAYINDNYVNGGNSGMIYPNQTPIQSQPIIVQNESGASSFLAGMIIGRSLMPDGSVYRGTPEQKTIIVNNYNITHPKTVVSTNTPNNTNVGTKPTMTYPAPAKVKSPGDMEAEKQKALMKQEADKKAAIEQRKAQLKAAQKARKHSNSGGFNSFSKKSVVNLSKKRKEDEK